MKPQKSDGQEERTRGKINAKLLIGSLKQVLWIKFHSRPVFRARRSGKLRPAG